MPKIALPKNLEIEILGQARLSRADFAVALIDEAEQADHPRERISVAY